MLVHIIYSNSPDGDDCIQAIYPEDKLVNAMAYEMLGNGYRRLYPFVEWNWGEIPTQNQVLTRNRTSQDGSGRETDCSD